MKRSWQFITGAVLCLTAGAALALDHQSCKPVVGHFEAFVVPPGEGHCPPDPAAFCTAGRVLGGIQGSYEFLMTGVAPAGSIGGVPWVLFFVGDSTIFLKGGDQLLGEDTGSIDLPPLGQGGFASLITFDGGTGDMGNAGGQIRLRGEFDAVEGTTIGDYIGTLCTE